MSSGYVNCGCRDCFEIAISGDDENEPALCNECEDAGCDCDGGECNRDDAYGGEDDDCDLTD